MTYIVQPGNPCTTRESADGRRGMAFAHTPICRLLQPFRSAPRLTAGAHGLCNSRTTRFAEVTDWRAKRVSQAGLVTEQACLRVPVPSTEEPWHEQL